MQPLSIKNRILRQLNKSKKGLSADMLASMLRLKKKERPAFLLSLSQMESSGELVKNKKGKYTVSQTVGCVEGRIMSMSKGFGFARLTESGEDCFIAGRNLKDALPGDMVLIRLGPRDDRGPQGEVTVIQQEGSRLFSGRLVQEDGRWMVQPDREIRFPVPVKKSTAEGLEPGDKVRFSVYWKDRGELGARVVTSYGSADSARVCADAIVDAHGIPTVFPEAVVQQAEKLRDGGIQPEELEGREDLREWDIFTIDGRDAKDLDDAVSLEKTPEGWRLGVHIADVSHYVRHRSVLDEEARLRGTSVYFADRVIPMLPEALSNGICSLNAGEDKLTLSALMVMDDQGNCQSCRIVKSVIRSKVRGVYSEINDLFQDTATREVKEKYAAVMESLTHMRRMAAALKSAAERRGTMDLISSEAQFTLDGQGHPVLIQPRLSGEAEGMIEQFMIAANEQVAAFARKKRLPFIYRVHEQPDPEKLELLSNTAQVLGLKARLPREGGSQMVLRELMEEARDTPYARLISDRLLRSMAKAAYCRNPLGHYGLALKDYCHFTSPIRRYPDLAIHRILSDVIAHVPAAEVYNRYESFAAAAADSSSECEVRAMTAERECEGCYKAEYMSAYLGKTFTGVVSSITEFGLYVELPNTVEGMIRPESLETGDGGELRFDGVASLCDARGRKRYTVGDAMEIQVAACDVSTGRITFLPAGE